MTAIKITPTITVIDKLFVQRAMKSVGMITIRIFQSMAIPCSASINTLSTTRAVNMQTGMNDSHLITGWGSSTLRTSKKGTTLGMTVTSAQLKMIRRIVKSTLIDLSPPQWLLQSSLIV